MSKVNLKISFVNPPHADWSLANNLTYLMCKEFYRAKGEFRDKVEWLEAPYKWNKYDSIDEILTELQDADIILFSSYIWNYKLLDRIATKAKEKWPEKLCVLGGPHIGIHEKSFLDSRTQYDFICRPTKPGEVFLEDLIDSWFKNEGKPQKQDISWAMGSSKERFFEFDHDYSVYELNFSYLEKMASYCFENSMEPFIVLETTRGCPYKCVYCEWGGGTNTKIYKRSLDLVKRDIDAIKKAGFRDAYLTDANFGAFLERDLEIFEYAWKKELNLTDISTVKTPNLKKRKQLVDSWFQIVGNQVKSNSRRSDGANMWDETALISIVPTVSIQSISDTAMKIAKRIDLPSKEKIELSIHIKKRCQEEGFPVPALELILGMPGSTLEDFYSEMELIWNFQAWNSYRHDYMFLPDSELCSAMYREKYKIETVEVYSDIVDEDGVDNWEGLFKNQKTNFKTIRSCFSFNSDHMKEMWFMNIAGNYLLKNAYGELKNLFTPGEFCKKCYNVIRNLEEFKTLENEINDLFNPLTEPRSIRRLGGQFRRECVENFLFSNQSVILSEVMKDRLFEGVQQC